MRLAVADLASVPELGRQEHLEPTQAVHLARKCVQGLEVLLLRDGITVASGVQGQAKLY